MKVHEMGLGMHKRMHRTTMATHSIMQGSRAGQQGSKGHEGVERQAREVDGPFILCRRWDNTAA